MSLNDCMYPCGPTYISSGRPLPFNDVTYVLPTGQPLWHPNSTYRVGRHWGTTLARGRFQFNGHRSDNYYGCCGISPDCHLCMGVLDLLVGNHRRMDFFVGNRRRVNLLVENRWHMLVTHRSHDQLPCASYRHDSSSHVAMVSS